MDLFKWEILPTYDANYYCLTSSCNAGGRWAFKLYPLLSSELLLDALQVALEARELDMRASPYDLYSYSPQLQYVNPGDGVSAISDTLGFNPEPILIETSEVRCYLMFGR